MIIAVQRKKYANCGGTKQLWNSLHTNKSFTKLNFWNSCCSEIASWGLQCCFISFQITVLPDSSISVFCLWGCQLQAMHWEARLILIKELKVYELQLPSPTWKHMWFPIQSLTFVVAILGESGHHCSPSSCLYLPKVRDDICLQI